MTTTTTTTMITTSMITTSMITIIASMITMITIAVLTAATTMGITTQATTMGIKQQQAIETTIITHMPHDTIPTTITQHDTQPHLPYLPPTTQHTIPHTPPTAQHTTAHMPQTPQIASIEAETPQVATIEAAMTHVATITNLAAISGDGIAMLYPFFQSFFDSFSQTILFFHYFFITFSAISGIIGSRAIKAIKAIKATKVIKRIKAVQVIKAVSLLLAIVVLTSEVLAAIEVITDIQDISGVSGVSNMASKNNEDKPIKTDESGLIGRVDIDVKNMTEEELAAAFKKLQLLNQQPASQATNAAVDGKPNERRSLTKEEIEERYKAKGLSYECCICNDTFYGYGNNAKPLKDGKCCDDCNMKVVMYRMMGAPSGEIEKSKKSKKQKTPKKEKATKATKAVKNEEAKPAIETPKAKKATKAKGAKKANGYINILKFDNESIVVQERGRPNRRGMRFAGIVGKDGESIRVKLVKLRAPTGVQVFDNDGKYDYSIMLAIDDDTETMEAIQSFFDTISSNAPDTDDMAFKEAVKEKNGKYFIVLKMPLKGNGFDVSVKDENGDTINLTPKNYKDYIKSHSHLTIAIEMRWIWYRKHDYGITFTPIQMKVYPPEEPKTPTFSIDQDMPDLCESSECESSEEEQ